MRNAKTKDRPMRMKIPPARRAFLIINTTLLCLLALFCLVPFLNLLAISLSSDEAVNAGQVGLFPVGFTLNAYKVLVTKVAFFRAFGYSVLRVVLGTLISVGVITLGAYPLSRSARSFTGRPFYIVLFTITMFFSGGLVPTYIVITKLGLMNNILALILPTAMNAWNMVLLINFFRSKSSCLFRCLRLQPSSCLLRCSIGTIGSTALYTCNPISSRCSRIFTTW